ncbi:MAG: hypothetical protein JWN04_102 [Myxococcaceae bacterium]|nr:hypothetical protein [Myxococcaceae bacterium]
MTNVFAFVERHERARAYAQLLRQRLIVQSAALRAGRAVKPAGRGEVARAALRLRAAVVAFDRALRAAPPARLDWRRAELEVARLRLEIAQAAFTPALAHAA